MRKLLVSLVFLFVAANPARAEGEVFSFPGVLEDCVQVGSVRFGPGERWARCEIVRSRWASTIGLADIHTLQYCLGDGEGACQARAQVLFANRAYTPVAHLLLQRLDAATMEYDDPLVFLNRHGYVMMLAQQDRGTTTRAYYVWQKDGWRPIEAQRWRGDLARQLPRDVRIADAGNIDDFDPGTMRASVALTRDGKPAGVADVALTLRRKRLAIAKVTLDAADKHGR